MERNHPQAPSLKTFLASSDLRFFGPRHYFYVIISDEASAPRVYFSNIWHLSWQWLDEDPLYKLWPHTNKENLFSSEDNWEHISCGFKQLPPFKCSNFESLHCIVRSNVCSMSSMHWWLLTPVSCLSGILGCRVQRRVSSWQRNSDQRTERRGREKEEMHFYWGRGIGQLWCSVKFKHNVNF